MPSTSLQLVPVKEIYRELVASTSLLLSQIYSPQIKKEIGILNAYLLSSCCSSALLNAKLGGAIKSLTLDLSTTTAKAIQDIRDQTDVTWADVVGKELVFEFHDQQIRQLGIAVPVIILTIMKTVTGHRKGRLSELLFPETPVKKTAKVKTVTKIVKQVKSYIRGTEAAQSCPQVSSSEIDLLHPLTEEESTHFVGNLMETGITAFGSIIGPYVGLQYTIPVFHVAAEIARQTRMGEISPMRAQHLHDSITRLSCLTQEHVLANRSTLSASHLEQARTSGPVRDPVARTLQYEILEQIGIVIADAISSVPNTVLQKAHSCAVSKDLLSDSSNSGFGTALWWFDDKGGETERENWERLCLKVTHFADFIQSLKPQSP